MYLEYYGLRELPFSITPDTSFFFAYDSHQEALNVLLVALRTGEGFIKIVGEVGHGKTLLCRKLLNELGGDFVTAYVPIPHLTPEGLRLALACELGLDVSVARTQEQLGRCLAERLLELAAEGKRVVLFLDEAQQLPDETFEAARLLTNLETEKRKLLQIVLLGQPELNRRLHNPSIRQLMQRIGFSYELRPLSGESVERYIRHRLHVAGYRGSPLFTPRAVRRIHAASRGTPRLINILCHKAMLAAFGDGAAPVTHRHVRRALADTDGLSTSTPRRWQYAGAAAVALSGGIGLCWQFARVLGGVP